MSCCPPGDLVYSGFSVLPSVLPVYMFLSPHTPFFTPCNRSITYYADGKGEGGGRGRVENFVQSFAVPYCALEACLVYGIPVRRGEIFVVLLTTEVGAPSKRTALLVYWLLYPVSLSGRRVWLFRFHCRALFASCFPGCILALFVVAFPSLFVSSCFGRASNKPAVDQPADSSTPSRQIVGTAICPWIDRPRRERDVSRRCRS